MGGSNWPPAKITLVLHVRTHFWPKEQHYFFMNLLYFYTELSALSNKPISSRLPKTLMPSKTRKTDFESGHFFGFFKIPAKLAFGASGRSYIKWSSCPDVFNAKTPIDLERKWKSYDFLKIFVIFIVRPIQTAIPWIP